MISMSDGIQIRAYEPGDEYEILRCFNETFAQVDRKFVPRTLEQWRWEFAENPGGFRIFLALDSEGRVVAQFASTPYRIWNGEEETRFNQIVDSMSHPNVSRTLVRKKTVFVHTALAYFDAYCGFGKDVVLYGLPVPIAWRIGRKYLGYHTVREQFILRRKIETAPPWPPMPSGIRVEASADVPACAEDLWERMRARATCTTVRDRAFLEWRYQKRPGVCYKFAVAYSKQDETPLGMFVYRFGDAFFESSGLVCDVVLPEDDTLACQALLSWLDEETRADHGASSICVLPPWSFGFAYFQEHGFRVETTRYFLVGRGWTKPYDMLWLRANWYYTLGDTDLV